MCYLLNVSHLSPKKGQCDVVEKLAGVGTDMIKCL